VVRELILKMPLTERKIPVEILEVLDLQPNQKLLMTLYSDKTITIEPAPRLKQTKTIAEPTVKVKPLKAKPSKAKPIKIKPYTPAISKDWIRIGKSKWLTLNGAVCRVVKGKLEPYMSTKKVREVVELIEEARSRSEAIKALMEKRNLKKNSAGMYYSVVKRVIPHLKEMKAVPEKEKPASVVAVTKEQAETQEKKEQEPA